MSLVPWKEYVRVMEVRFGRLACEGPLADLKKLQQEGDLQSYLEAFKVLFSKVTFTEEHG